MPKLQSKILYCKIRYITNIIIAPITITPIILLNIILKNQGIFNGTLTQKNTINTVSSIIYIA